MSRGHPGSGILDRFGIRYFTPLALVGVAAVFALTSGVVGLPAGLFVSLALCAAVGVTMVAYCFPLVTVALTIVMGQVVDRDLIELEAIAFPAFSGLLIRFFDPVLLGIAAATLLRFLGDDRRLLRFLGGYSAWTLLLAWLVFQVARTAGDVGLVSALGEFRTYYQYLLLVPYIVVSFRDARAQWYLFGLLVWSALLFIPLAFLRGALDYSFTVGPRWFNASSNFALLTAVIALFVGEKFQSFAWTRAGWWFVMAAFAFLTLVNTHRSVWLASTVAIALLLASGSVPLRKQAQIAVVSLLGLGAAALVFQSGQQAPGSQGRFASFLQERAAAFTNPEEDATASWRLALWRQALDEVEKQPVTGVGLGRGFEFDAPGPGVVTTFPHSFYITLAYHAGIPALVAYGVFLLQYLAGSARTLGRRVSPKERTMVLAAMIVTVSGHAVFLVYQHEFYSLLYLGLAVSVTLNARTTLRVTQNTSDAPITSRI